MKYQFLVGSLNDRLTDSKGILFGLARSIMEVVQRTEAVWRDNLVASVQRELFVHFDSVGFEVGAGRSSCPLLQSGSRNTVVELDRWLDKIDVFPNVRWNGIIVAACQ
jgi:hypothetical protein